MVPSFQELSYFVWSNLWMPTWNNSLP
jgi:hypothetical protein